MIQPTRKTPKRIAKKRTRRVQFKQYYTPCYQRKQYELDQIRFDLGLHLELNRIQLDDDEQQELYDM